MYVKDPYETKLQFLINKRGSAGLKHFNDSKAFIEYSNDTQDIYQNIEEYNLRKKRKILIGFEYTFSSWKFQIHENFKKLH